MCILPCNMLLFVLSMCKCAQIVVFSKQLKNADPFWGKPNYE